MAVSEKTKKELIEEINALRTRLNELEHSEAEHRKSEQALKKTQDIPLEEGICVSDINIEWKHNKGLCTFEKLPVAMMWINSTLAGLMSGVQAMVGTQRFGLALQSEGRKSVEDDWQVISQFPDFKEGFKAIANIAAVAGWGDWQLIYMDDENKECLFRVWNSWEGRYQKALGVCWGSGMLAGKLAGYCSKLFKTNCWADQTSFIARGDEFDEFRVRPSERSIEKEIENLLATDKATRADMAVAMEKLRLEISTRKKAEEAMKKSSVILDSTTDAVVCTDTVGNITFWNKGAEIIYGYRKEEAMGKPVSILYKDQDLHVLSSIIADLLEAKDIPGIEVTCINKDKQDVEILLSLTTIKDEDGNVSEFVGITKDITEHKKWQEALRQSEQKFRMFFENQPEYCYMISTEGIILEANSAVLSALDYTKEELVGKNLENLYAPESRERARQLFAQWKQTGEIRDEEMVIITKSGDRRTVLLSSTQVLSEDGKLLHSVSIQRDITERMKAEEALRQSEERFKILFESAPDAYYIHDLEGNFIDGNKAAEQLVGYSEEEAVGKSFLDLGLIAGEDISKVSVTMAENRAGKPAGPLELTVHRKDGDKVFVETRSYPVEIGGQTVVLGIARDITERKRLEEAYQSLVDQSLQGLAIIQDGRIVFLNKAFSSSTGYTIEEMLAASPEQLQSLVHPDDRKLVWSRNRDRLAGKETPDRYEFRWIRKDGSICWVEIHASKIEYQGRPAIQAAYIDVTERKKAEDALRQSEERLKVLFESAPDAIYLNDLKGNFVDGNKATEEMLGYSKSELQGRSFIETELLTSKQAKKVKANLKMIGKRKPTGPDEFTLTRKDGISVDVEIRTFPVNIGERMLSLGIARDISARKITERKLIEHQAQLKSLASELSLTEERERHRLATDLHDQISQSLVFSRIKLQQLHASLPSEEIAKSLEDVYQNLDRIIQDTRTLTFDLSSPILYELGFEAAVAEWLEEQIGKKHSIKTHFEDDNRPKPLEDDIRVLLFRNVRELLVNVIKHAHAKNVKVSIRRIRKQINVLVEDDGIGFNPAEALSSRGFGIFSIRERLEQLAGRIHIESEPGRGCKITMVAPLKYNKKSK